MFHPGQIGPHIYDNNGELVWSGSHLYDDRTTFDFKVATHNGSQYLTFIAGEDLHEDESPGGSGVILDSSYQHVKTVDERNGRGTMNMHEFTTIEDGTRALMITYGSTFSEVQSPNGQSKKIFVGNNGFSEVDTATGKAVFSWWALDHLDPSESHVDLDFSAHLNYGSPWDFFHMNSVDKNAGGDYLISARYTDTIYKISGTDGSILWRLGGKKSDFELDGFNFSSQHDARFKQESSGRTMITFFNNHSDGNRATAKTSSAMEVSLDMKTMKATLVNEWHRPDGQLTKLRGNTQVLDSGRVFVGWSENTYVSEFNTDGELVMEAQMAAHRFNTYRTYKFNFTAQPSEPIVERAFVYGATPETSTTVVYVSWNGATEVAEWKFYSWRDDARVLLGSIARTGFETTFMVSGAATNVVAEAVDVNGRSLRQSDAVLAILPSAWTQKGSEVFTATQTTPTQHKSHLHSQNSEPNATTYKDDPSLHVKIDNTGDVDSQEDHRVNSSWESDDLPRPPVNFLSVAGFVLAVTVISLAGFTFRRRRSSLRRQPPWRKCELANDAV